MRFVRITFEGRCLRTVTRASGETLLRADESHLGDGAVFERIDLAHGRVAFRLADDRYLARHAAHPGSDDTGDSASLQLVTELTQCTAFEELPAPDGLVALRACDLRFLGVLASGAVVADRVSDGSWERFGYLEVPAPSLPAQTSPPSQPAAFAAV